VVLDQHDQKLERSALETQAFGAPSKLMCVEVEFEIAKSIQALHRHPLDLCGLQWGHNQAAAILSRDKRLHDAGCG